MPQACHTTQINVKFGGERRVGLENRTRWYPAR